MSKETIFLGSDHAAFSAKETLKKSLLEQGHDVQDLGTHSNERASYSEYAIAVAKEVALGKGRGILLCGSGIGVSMAANRFKNVRAALCRTKEDAKLSRLHNNANILCLGARVNSDEEIIEITKTWLKTEFEGGRHEDRIACFNNLGQ